MTAEPRLLLTSFAIERGPRYGFAAQGRFELAPRVTVLVGPNGAGKSFLVDGLFQSASLTPPPLAEFPTEARFTWSEADNHASTHTNYVQKYGPLQSSTITIEEQVTVGAEVVLSVADQAATWGSESVRLEPRLSLFKANLPLPPRLEGVRRWLAGVRMVPAGVPRDGSSDLVLFRAGPGDPWRAKTRGRLAALAERLAVWSGTDEQQVLQTVLKRLRLPDALWFFTAAPPGGEEFAVVLLANKHLYALPDGTLRVLEILVDLLDPAATLVLIEEPETAIHPGLLHRLLAEITARASDLQVVLTTHAPQVVSAFSPRDIRVVGWTDQGPTATPLTETQLRSVQEWLLEDGNLGEYVYSGALDNG